MLIKIRNAKKEDLEDIARINVECWKTAYKGIIDDEFLKNMQVESKKETMTKRLKQGLGIIVAEINNEVSGYSTIIDNNTLSNDLKEVDCELLALYVDINKHGNGVGTKLVKFVKDKFKSEGKEKMIIWCLKDNMPSRKFYEKVGGKLYAEKTAQIGDKEYEEVAFIYDL